MVAPDLSTMQHPVPGTDPVVSVEDLQVRFLGPDAVTYAVNGVDFTLARGEVLALLGESGCGKSVTLRALLRLLPADRTQIEGNIRIDGRDVLGLDQRELTALRGGAAAMIFQEPMTAFDPVYTVGEQIAETIRFHQRVGRAAARAMVLELLEKVQVPSPARRMQAYPYELSGGLRQRAMIALALSCRPGVLLADEPTTALDVTVQMQILLLLRSLQREFGMAVLFVTHDIAVAAEVATRVAVMYAGKIVESGTARAVLKTPAHPYTRGLIEASARHLKGVQLPTIAGAPPRLTAPPAGCGFAPRCSRAIARCLEAVPDSVEVSPRHLAWCIRIGA